MMRCGSSNNRRRYAVKGDTTTSDEEDMDIVIDDGGEASSGCTKPKSFLRTFDRQLLKDWFEKKGLVCPLTGEPVSGAIVRNEPIRGYLKEWEESKAELITKCQVVLSSKQSDVNCVCSSDFRSPATTPPVAPALLRPGLSPADGDLLSLLSARGGRIPEREAAGLAAQLASVLAACHRRGVAHRDVKPDNLLFDAATGALKLADFGSAEWFGDGRPMSGLVGTPYYVAPEVVAGREYGEKVDVWSAGVVLYMMLSGAVPFYGATAPEIFEAVLRGNLRFPPRAFADVSPEAKDLMRRMLCKDVSRRLSAEQVLRHPWIASCGGDAVAG
ncbi:hypothetical protein ZWY2020_021792 [Hordeum vulgare]|nr:hypothetical protein ZWY2020_021792 [Hordeum vulgare]